MKSIEWFYENICELVIGANKVGGDFSGEHFL